MKLLYFRPSINQISTLQIFLISFSMVKKRLVFNNGAPFSPNYMLVQQIRKLSH